MSPKIRYGEIDTLRGIAILAMIAIHVCYYYQQDRIASFLWDYLQFAVQVFVFCSTFLLIKKEQRYTLKSLALYTKRRLFRLTIPYYIFLIFFVGAVWIFEPTHVTLSYVLQSIFLIGGVDINWLVLLFLQFSLLMPFLIEIRRVAHPIFFLYVGLSVGSTILFLFYKLPFDYKWIMWLPWSTLIIFTIYFLQWTKSVQKYIAIFSLSLILFFVSRFYLAAMGHKLSLFENKYPPDSYFLLYGILGIFVLYFLATRKSMHFLAKPIHYLSLYSYQIYFIHYLLLYILIVGFKLITLPWYVVLGLLLGATLLLMEVIRRGQQLLSHSQKT